MTWLPGNSGRLHILADWASASNQIETGVGMDGHKQACIFLGQPFVPVGGDRVGRALGGNLLLHDARAVIIEIDLVHAAIPPGTRKPSQNRSGAELGQ